MTATQLTIGKETGSGDGVRAAILNGLRAYNRRHAPAPGFEPLILSARAGDELVAGLVGETGWQWLHVEMLWVAERWRRRGLGRQLLQAAEHEAALRGARHVYLDTFDYQARPFYERQGYVVFGIQEDYPPDHTRYFMRKELQLRPAGS